MSSKEPRLRITQWLSTNASALEIPLEGECTACADARFSARHNFRGKFHEPKRAHYLQTLEHLFDQHLQEVHPKATRWAREVPPERWIDSLRKGRTELALKQLQEQPDSPSKFSSLGVVLIWNGDFQAALAHFDGQIKANRPPNWPSDFCYGMAGVAAWCLEDYKQAVKYWKKGTTAGYTVGAANTRTSLLLYAASILKPEIVSITTAVHNLSKKENHLRIRYWPGPIAKFILGRATEEDVKREAVYKNQEPRKKNPKTWQFEFYKALKSKASERQALRRKLKSLGKVEGSDYLAGTNLFYFLRQEEFYLARDWVPVSDRKG